MRPIWDRSKQSHVERCSRTLHVLYNRANFLLSSLALCASVGTPRQVQETGLDYDLRLIYFYSATFTCGHDQMRFTPSICTLTELLSLDWLFLYLQQLWYYFLNCVYRFILTHPVSFSCGRKPEHPEKTHDFWKSVDGLFSHESVARIKHTISELKGACSDHLRFGSVRHRFNISIDLNVC